MLFNVVGFDVTDEELKLPMLVDGVACSLFKADVYVAGGYGCGL